MKLRRYLAGLTVLCLLLIPAGANSFWQSREQNAGGGFSPSCTESSNFIARTSGLDTAHKIAYDGLICGLVTDSIWSKLDWLHVYATQDSTTAILSLVSATYNGTNVGAHFVADRGMTGGPGGYIDSNFNGFIASSPQFTQNSSHLALWSVIDVGPVNDGPFGMDSFLGETEIHPFYGDSKSYYRVNGSGVSGVTNTTAVGFYLANRSTSTLLQGYKDGANVFSTSDNSHAPLNHSFPTCAQYHYDAGTTVPAAHQLAMASMGSSLSSTDVTNFYNRLRTYMTAVGVP